MESKNLISAAHKVIKYRRHVLSSENIFHIEELISNIKSAKEEHKIKENNATLAAYLNEHGGDIFPIKFLNDNTEIFFVAALLAIAIRTFFIQSFQIPTNSMFPTYAGMTHKINIVEQKNAATKLLNKIKFFSTNVNIIAENGGEILIPLARTNLTNQNHISYIVPYENSTVKTLGGLLNKRIRIYTIFVGNIPHKITTPADFSIDKVLMEHFWSTKTAWGEIATDENLFSTNSRGIYMLDTKKVVKKGKKILDFEIIRGDMLLVDKMSYHFSTPKAGDSIVFITDKLEKFRDSPKFFIKRLIGKPSDTLKIQRNQVIRNGFVMQNNDVLLKINSKFDGYKNGYIPAGLLDNGKEIVVPKEKVFVLGDNSADSYDSRFWGFVPEKSICGRPLVIFYPFSNRFGLCK